MMTKKAAAEPDDAPRGTGAFEVHLDVFEGPFDLLLGLISKHKLDITEVSLSKVTDEFIAYIRHRSGGWDLDQVSYFLLVAATLLDLKAARLLPSGEVEDEEDLALLEARDDADRADTLLALLRMGAAESAGQPGDRPGHSVS